MPRANVERMLFRALERVRELDGELWKKVFDPEMREWHESHFRAMDDAERKEVEYHREFRKLIQEQKRGK